MAYRVDPQMWVMVLVDTARRPPQHSCARRPAAWWPTVQPATTPSEVTGWP